jgi:hypothetical protein
VVKIVKDIMNPKTTRELILSITERLDKPPETVEPLIKKLEDDWFDTADSLKKLTDKKWDTYSIPQRLLLEIKLALNTPTIVPVAEVKVVEDDVADERTEQTRKERLDILNSEETKEISETWERLLERISEEIQFISAIIETLNLLCKIVKNIIESPTDQGKRKLRLSNAVIQQKISKYSGVMNFLFKVLI